MMLPIKMNDYNDFLTDGTGIFQTLYSSYGSTLTFLTEDDAETLDMEYYLNHSGEKFVSPIVYKLYTNDSTTYLTNIAKILTLKFKDKWLRLYNAIIQSTYDPIENYSSTENEYMGTSVTNSTSGTQSKFGFNSDDEASDTDSSSASTTTTGLFDDNHRQLTRSGNIGVTTSQQMLESEINLRRWNFYQEMMDDIDSVMCLAIRRLR